MKLKINLNILFSNLLFVFCIFPYVTIINTPFDVQPYVLILSFIILAYWILNKDKIRIDLNILLLFIPLTTALAYFILSNNKLDAARSLFGYFSIIVIYICAKNNFNKVNGKILLYALIIWLFVGLVQTFFSRYFGDFLLPRISTSPNRGVTSLSVEPSAYGNMMFFFLILNDVFHYRGDYNKKIYRIIMIISIFQIFLSKAGLSFMLLVFYLFSKSMFISSIRKKVINIFKLFLQIALLLFLIKNIEVLAKSRIGSIISRLENGVIELLLSDGSLSDRLGHIIISIGSIRFNYSLGFGLSTWEQNFYYILERSSNFAKELANVNISIHNRVLSGWGSVIYELGIIGLLIIIVYLRIIFKNKGITNKKTKEVIHISGVNVFFGILMAISISFPLLGYMMGILENIKIYESKN